MTLTVLVVTLRDWTRSVTLHTNEAEAYARLRVGFPQHAALSDAELIEAINQDGHEVVLDAAETPERC